MFRSQCQAAASLATKLKTVRPRLDSTQHVCRTKRYYSDVRQPTPNIKLLHSITDSGPGLPFWDDAFGGDLAVEDDSTQTKKPVMRRRRQAMTNQEINAFNDMFSMIFDAASEVNKSPHDVELQRDDIGQLFSKLRRHSKRKWTTVEENDLDRKREEMERCDTDQELLQWAMSELFEDSVRQEAASRKAIEEAENGGRLTALPRLQSPSYPHLLALLMETFRDRYRDPHLALSMFDHARNLSIVSYVFGCTTKAYNELIKTRWFSLRDLKGVHDALQEMSVNGVLIDEHTRRIVDKIVQEAGASNLWTEEDPLGKTDEVWNIVQRIQNLVALQKEEDKGRRSRKQPAKWDEWKTDPLLDREDDGFGFDKWDEPEREGRTRATELY